MSHHGLVELFLRSHLRAVIADGVQPEGSRHCVRSAAAKTAACRTGTFAAPLRATCQALSTVAAQSGKLWKHESFEAGVLLLTLSGRPLGCTVPFEIRWQGDRSLISGVVHSDGSAYEGARRRLVRCRMGTGGKHRRWASHLSRCVRSRVIGFLMFFRIARASAQYVTDSSFVEQGENQHGRKATEAIPSARLARNRCLEEMERRLFCAFLCAKSRHTPLLMRRALASSLLPTWLMRLASWCFWSTVPRPSSGRRATRPTWLSPVGLTYGSLDCGHWIPGRGRANARRHGRARSWPLPLRVIPAIQRLGHTSWKASLDVCARNVSTQSARRVIDVPALGALECAAQPFSFGLTALRAADSLISCREARWSPCSAPCVVLTVVAWSSGPCSAFALVLRLLGDCWLCMTCCCLVPSALHG